MNNHEDIVLYIGEDTQERMEAKGIREKELKMVIATAEETGVKLRNEEGSHFLAKLKIADVYYCAEYEVEGDGFKVLEAYSHKTHATGW